MGISMLDSYWIVYIKLEMNAIPLDSISYSTVKTNTSTHNVSDRDIERIKFFLFKTTKLLSFC